MKRQTAAYSYALLAVLCWSTVASAFKLALRELDVLNLLVIASLTSTLVLGIVVAVRGNIGSVLRQSPAAWGRAALVGALNPFAYYLVLFAAYDRLPAQEAQPLNYTWPIALSLLAVPVLHQRIRARQFVALLVSFAGVIVIATRGRITSLTLSDLFGVALALGSGLIWAAYWLLNLRDKRDASVKLFTGFLFGTVYVVVSGLCMNRLQIPSLWGVLTAAYAGVFEMGLTFILWMKALEYAKQSAQVSNLAYLTPFISLVFIRFIVGETIQATSVAGLILIVAGILLQSVPAKRSGINQRRRDTR